MAGPVSTNATTSFTSKIVRLAVLWFFPAKTVAPPLHAASVGSSRYLKITFLVASLRKMMKDDNLHFDSKRKLMHFNRIGRKNHLKKTIFQKKSNDFWQHTWPLWKSRYKSTYFYHSVRYNVDGFRSKTLMILFEKTDVDKRFRLKVTVLVILRQKYQMKSPTHSIFEAKTVLEGGYSINGQ